MFACNVSIHLKSNTLSDCTRTFENDVLPLLRKQNGFKAEITFAGPGGVDVTAISLWANKADAEAYNTKTYPQVLKTMARLIEGTPKVQISDVVNSTFHKVAVHAAAENVSFFAWEGGITPPSQLTKCTSIYHLERRFLP